MAYMIAYYCWIFDDEHAESLHNKKCSFTKKENDYIKSLNNNHYKLSFKLWTLEILSEKALTIAFPNFR